MKQEIKLGTTDYTAQILIRDTAGAAKTGLTNASAGLDVSYSRVETDNDVVVTAGAPVALASPALTDPHLDWGFLEVDATNHPGLYRLDIADGVFAAGAWSVVVTLIGTGLDPTHIEYILVANDKLDGVRMGLTALPNAAADAAGGLPISVAGGLDLDAMNTAAVRLTATRATYLDYLFSIYFGLVSVVAQAQAGAAGTITLAAASSAVNDFYKGQVIVLYVGTGAGQARVVTAYDGGTKVATISPNWAIAPDGTSWYVITTFGSAILPVATQASIDAIEADTTTDIPALIATAQADLDIITGATGANLLAATQASIDAIEADTDELQTDDYPTSIAALPTAAEIKTAIEADGGDLSSLMEALVNKAIWTEADGQLEMFNDADVSQGTIAAQISTDGTFTTRKRTLL